MLKGEIDRCLKRKRPGLLERKPGIDRVENHLDKARKHHFVVQIYQRMKIR